MGTGWTKPTGFQKGRPRRGEIRPLTPGGQEQTRYRSNHKNDLEWKQVQAMYQQFWRLANLERRRETARNSQRRKKSWELANGKFIIGN